MGTGRANPDHIGYLYLSEDENTPIYEVRRTIGQMVSIASFRVQKNLRIYDFTKDIPIKHDILNEETTKPNRKKPMLTESCRHRLFFCNLIIDIST